MEFDALLLSRIQFAYTVAYHIIFPTLSIGLAWFLVVIRGFEFFSKDEFQQKIYRRTFDFWLRIFGLSFGMGVVTGVVLSYEIGTNWGRFSEIAGPVVGPLMSFEVLSAFFLEAGFLGIMLLGRRRTGGFIHFFATCMVALGTLLSAFWIISANSFMHTPAGYELVDGQILPKDWVAAIFNPSFPYRLAHMMVAAYLTTAFVVAAVGARYLLKSESVAFGKDMLRAGLITASILIPIQIFIGDLHGLNTLEYQPAKIAAMEGHWETSENVPLVLFGIPDEEAQINHYEIAIPNVTSLILTHTWDGEVKGLTDPEFNGDTPPVAIVFFSFRIMIGIGLMMLLLSWLGVWQLWRGTLFKRSRFARAYLFCIKWFWPAGFIAILAGWITTEVGRQPWVVHGLLRTSDASSLVPGSNVALSLALFVIVYTLFMIIFLLFVRFLLKRGPGNLPDDLGLGVQPDAKPKPAFMTETQEPEGKRRGSAGKAEGLDDA